MNWLLQIYLDRRRSHHFLPVEHEPHLHFEGPHQRRLVLFPVRQRDFPSIVDIVELVPGVFEEAHVFDPDAGGPGQVGLFTDQWVGENLERETAACRVEIKYATVKIAVGGASVGVSCQIGEPLKGSQAQVVVEIVRDIPDGSVGVLLRVEVPTPPRVDTSLGLQRTPTLSLDAQPQNGLHLPYLRHIAFQIGRDGDNLNLACKIEAVVEIQFDHRHSPLVDFESAGDADELALQIVANMGVLDKRSQQNPTVPRGLALLVPGLLDLFRFLQAAAVFDLLIPPHLDLLQIDVQVLLRPVLKNVGLAVELALQSSGGLLARGVGAEGGFGMFGAQLKLEAEQFGLGQFGANINDGLDLHVVVSGVVVLLLFLHSQIYILKSVPPFAAPSSRIPQEIIHPHRQTAPH